MQKQTIAGNALALMQDQRETLILVVGEREADDPEERAKAKGAKGVEEEATILDHLGIS